MDDRKIIIILLVIIIIILAAGLIMMAPSLNKEGCNLTISQENVQAGDNLIVSLKDLNGNAISDETIHIKLESENNTPIEKDIKTNSKGIAKLKLSKTGQYTVIGKFDGNEEFKSGSAREIVDVVEASKTSSDSQHTISVVPEFDKTVKKADGEYTVEATKWRGGSVGGFEVSLYKNGQLMDRNSYQSRAYFNDGSGWKWSNWDYGEESGATLHKYPVSNTVEIKDVEVNFYG